MASKEIPDYPNNSFLARSAPAEEKGAEKELRKPVVTEGVKVKKKPLSKKLSDAIFGEEVDSVKDYLIFDVLVPGIRDAVCDSLRGGTRYYNRNRRGDIVSSTFDYVGRYLDPVAPNRRQSQIRRETRKPSLDSLIFQREEDAEAVIAELSDIFETEGCVRLADLYRAIGTSSDYTDERYGWTTMRGIRTIAMRDGIKLVMPRMELLD